jgi:hypothetical protein
VIHYFTYIPCVRKPIHYIPNTRKRWGLSQPLWTHIQDRYFIWQIPFVTIHQHSNAGVSHSTQQRWFIRYTSRQEVTNNTGKIMTLESNVAKTWSLQSAGPVSSVYSRTAYTKEIKINGKFHSKFPLKTPVVGSRSKFQNWCERRNSEITMRNGQLRDHQLLPRPTNFQRAVNGFPLQDRASCIPCVCNLHAFRVGGVSHQSLTSRG